ncbi:His Kinase A (phospho-acceptor) domain-containing protein [Chitinophaga sp. CF118]|uniref:sensor histidine kinase n=1 Tax=Chitinophaga sp. CF118 TaxID=1884367 RepID=UPI0008E83D15|nr:7TM diverse intracellular signaling domain-containing protein [Chitinophaga sp. CF118]SFD76451.1 His Kinase A (phospho-acceptor) domain-containing protein [Chitinophaga sp. CF118]
MFFSIRRLVLTAILFVRSTTSFPQVFLDAEKSTYHLGNTLEYFEDKSAAIKGTQIITGEFDNQFKKAHTETLNSGVRDAAIWLKFTLRNPHPEQYNSWILAFDYPLFDHITFYDKRTDGQWVIHQTGDMLPYSSREMQYRNFIFTLTLPDTVPHTYYIRIATSGSMQIGLTLQKEAAFFRDELYAELGHGIFFGALMIMLCYNLFLFFSLKDKAYLTYVLFTLINLLLQAAFSGHITQYILGDAPYWANTIIPLLLSCSSIITVLFCITFLNTSRFAKKIHIILISIIILSAINFFLSFFLKMAVSLSIAELLIMFSCITAGVAGIISLRRGNNAARFYLVAWAFLIGSWLVTVLRNFGFIEANFFTTNCVRIALLVEAIMLALSLADKYNLYKKEKEAAQLEDLRIQKEAIRELEQKVTERTARLNQSLAELTNAQAQLVQKEKIASLGDLTAGIAHEIQNPLNFVTNFAELSEELVNELKAGIYDSKQLVLTDHLSNNLSKITHHSQRADSIVKGMLSHSRINKGEKRYVILNALTEESIQIALQSFKTKNKDFDLTLTRNFDHSIKQFHCNPQEFGSVLMNIYTNAFYALQKKIEKSGEDYQPELTITTRNAKQWIEIIVHDNGIGIHPLSLEKIFQPFFTTRPTHQGTGLGLSLSYGIIVKGLDGELTVRSEENVYAEFTIRLPH